MQIDFIITELDVGGAERTLVRLATNLKAAGDDVRVFAMGPLPDGRRRDGRDQLVRQLVDAGVDLTSGNGRTALDFPRVARELIRWMQRRPNAVRQSFLFHANVASSFAVWAAAGRLGGVDIGGVRVADPNPRRIWIESRALARKDHVVCVSTAAKTFTRDRYGVDANRTSVIGNSVDVDHFANSVAMDWSELGWQSDASVVLFIGRLHHQKNLALLQRHVDEFIPSASNRKLVLMGQGPLQEELKAWAESVNQRSSDQRSSDQRSLSSGSPSPSYSADRVRWVPWQADVAPWIQAARVLVLPSHYEGMPNVVMEAMAAGKPVVCSRVEGSGELIGDDEHQGFTSGDGPEMVRCLNRFLEDEAFAHRVGVANQDRMRHDFSVQSMVTAYRELYLRLLSSKTKRVPPHSTRQ